MSQPATGSDLERLIRGEDRALGEVRGLIVDGVPLPRWPSHLQQALFLALTAQAGADAERSKAQKLAEHLFLWELSPPALRRLAERLRADLADILPRDGSPLVFEEKKP